MQFLDKVGLRKLLEYLKPKLGGTVDITEHDTSPDAHQSMFSSKLDSNGKAADSSLLNGRSDYLLNESISAWAKAANKPSYGASEVGASPTGHPHTIANITNLQNTLDTKLETVTVPNSHVTNARMANMTADRIKGRVSTSGAPQDLTATQVNTMLGTVTKSKFTLSNNLLTIDLS